MKKNPAPPVANKIPKELSIHDHTRIDNYYWLNDRNDPEVIKYLKEENKYTEEGLSHTKKFQEKLYKEIIGRIKEDDNSVPYFLNGYYYYTKYTKGNNYPFHCRKKESIENEEEILLNVNELAKDHNFYEVGDLAISSNNKLLGFSEDLVSRRIYTIRFKNLERDEWLKDKIEGTSGGFCWAEDNQTIFYTEIDPQTLRSYRVKRHVLGTNSTEDETVFEELDDTYSCYVYKSKSRKYIIIGTYSTLSTEYHILPSDQALGKFKPFQKRQKEIEYSIDHRNDTFFILTNWKAKNFRLMETKESATEMDNWEEIIPHRIEILLEDIEVFDDFIALEERKEGLTRIRIISNTHNDDYHIPFNDEAFVTSIGINPEMKSNTLRFHYSSLTTPNSVYDFSLSNRKKVLMKQQEIIGGYDHLQYDSKRITALSDDGVKIPISLVYKKTTSIDGTAPCLLYGYGSYGVNISPYFSSVRLSLLDRGFVFAIAHTRGSETLGRKWYEDGKMLNKKNTFKDFISCGEHLIEQKYAHPKKLYAMGGSAGGLLMGAIINMKPELWNGVVAEVPFVDVVTTMLDKSIPLTTGEFDEWGNPMDKVYYEYILSYSPYDNIENKHYPPLLITTGLHDSQVQYWEPAKWVAKLRDLKSGDNPIYLHCNMETGHGGASGRFERFKETALAYSFFFDLEGLINQ